MLDPAAVESSGVPFQGGGGPSRTFRAEARWSCYDPFMVCHIPSGEKKLKKRQEGVSMRVQLHVLGACVV